ncbi:MAG: (d)CMP kinase, partial [Holophaga sp.]|nr:(d)CMP kinase [Holophaga sp.]
RRGFRKIEAGPDHEPYGLFCVASGHQLGFNDLKAIEVARYVLAIAGKTPEPFNFRAGLRIQQRGTREFLGDEDVSDAIRSPEVSRMVTPVSADGRVREVLVDQQRAIAGSGGWVVDGRDIGTVVFPDACCKVFLTASVDVRARRRALELEAKGTPQPLAEVAADIQRRDLADSTRAVAPLRKAGDAVELDSGGLSLEEVVQWIVGLHRRH